MGDPLNRCGENETPVEAEAGATQALLEVVVTIKA
jgi:hypothetical protein